MAGFMSMHNLAPSVVTADSNSRIEKPGLARNRRAGQHHKREGFDPDQKSLSYATFLAMRELLLGVLRREIDLYQENMPGYQYPTA